MARSSSRRWLTAAVIAAGCFGGQLLAGGPPADAAAPVTENMVPTAYHAYAHCYDDSAGADGPVCQTDNATLTVYRQSSLTSGERSLIQTELGADYAPTVFSISYETASTVSYSGSAETDIIYQKSPYQYGTTTWSSGLIGETWCNDAVNSAHCDQQYVRFNSDSSLGCMVTPINDSLDSLTSLERREINATY